MSSVCHYRYCQSWSADAGCLLLIPDYEIIFHGIHIQILEKMALSFLRTKVITRQVKKQFYQNKRNAGYVVL